MALGSPRSLNRRWKAVNAVSLAGRLKGLAHENEARGLVSDGQGVTVIAVAEAELPFEVGAPERVGVRDVSQRCAHGLVTPRFGALHKAMAVEHGMNSASGGDAHIAGEALDQQLADLARAPVRLLTLGSDDQGLDLSGELVGVTPGPARAVGEGLEPVLLIAIEDLVAGLAGDAELAGEIGHGLTLQQADDEAQAFFHHRTLLPGHLHLPPKSRKCYPCVRYVLSPMSRVAHSPGLIGGCTRSRAVKLRPR